MQPHSARASAAVHSSWDLKPVLRAGRGRTLAATVKELTPILRGWIAYFRLSEAERAARDLDGWLRRKLRWVVC
ncbi:group II intron maturase-specific domain-containing protein [Sinorhizobium meliloti]|uniref:group II intron maturase-specific domain-containing protein n=1 Tax=Rhizobium meliloti TaxID=382 RepID=UPI000B496E56|nr:group II intron maturase-specific domain-containing protein [Sinorhizobium meliloti]ASP87149.1 hypothetical protein CDO26_21970 [Sinorhizobium meliloti]MQW29693.1 hypothetical protein [Sinorhizobium meliloti]RVJ64103.1 hypothetical protein CN171_34835 [Sinorhizobium meliloti]